MVVLFLPEMNIEIVITCIFFLLEISTDIFFIFLIIGLRVTLYATVKEKSLKYAIYTILFFLLIVYKIIRILSLVVNIVTWRIISKRPIPRTCSEAGNYKKMLPKESGAVCPPSGKELFHWIKNRIVLPTDPLTVTDKKWEKYVTDTTKPDGYPIRFTYGFNILFINEDYVSSYYERGNL